MWQFDTARTPFTSRPNGPWVCRPWLLALAALLAGAVSSLAQERYRSNDPVEDLRQALREDRPPSADSANMKLEFALDYRKQQLDEHIKALRNLGDMSRALLLQDWRIDPLLDVQVRALDREEWDALAKRFGHAIRSGLADRSTPARQVAVAHLLADTANAARESATRQAGLVRALVADFGEDLIKVIRDRAESPAARAAAAEALGLINPKDKKGAVDALQQFLHDGDVPERRVAAQTLTSLITVLAQKENKFQGEQRLDKLEVLIQQTAELAVPAAASGLTDPDPLVRRNCVEALNQAALAASDLIIIPNARTLLFPPKDRPPTEEEAAMMRGHAVRVQDEIAAISGLTRALKDALLPPANSGRRGLAQLSATDPDARVRLLARETIDEIGGVLQRIRELQATVPPLPPAPKPAPQLEAVLANRRRKPSAVLTAQPRGEPPQEQLQKALTQTLPDLVAGLGDRDPKLRLAAIEAIERLGEAGAPAAPDLARMLNDRNPFVRWAAARALSKQAPASANVVVPALARLLLDVDTDVQVNAARALERYGPAARFAIAALTRVLTATDLEIRSGRSDVEVRQAALHALESIGHDDPRLVLPAVTIAVDSGDAEVRRTAAEILARFGPLARPSEPVLLRHLRDSDPDVRRAVSDALLAIQPLPR